MSNNPYKTREGGATVTIFVPYDCHNKCPFCINKEEYSNMTGFDEAKIIQSIHTMTSYLQAENLSPIWSRSSA